MVERLASSGVRERGKVWGRSGQTILLPSGVSPHPPLVIVTQIGDTLGEDHPKYQTFRSEWESGV